jgi:hypothetical protein
MCSPTIRVHQASAVTTFVRATSTVGATVGKPNVDIFRIAALRETASAGSVAMRLAARVSVRRGRLDERSTLLRALSMSPHGNARAVFAPPKERSARHAYRDQFGGNSWWATTVRLRMRVRRRCDWQGTSADFRWHSGQSLEAFILESGLVGAGRFERPTPCAQGRCATRLRYAPTFVLF